MGKSSLPTGSVVRKKEKEKEGSTVVRKCCSSVVSAMASGARGPTYYSCHQRGSTEVRKCGRSVVSALASGARGRPHILFPPPAKKIWCLNMLLNPFMLFAGMT